MVEALLQSLGWGQCTRVHRDQLASLARATPAAMAGYALNAALAVLALRGFVPALPLVVWGILSLALCAYVGVRSLRSRPPVDGNARKSPMRSARNALLFGFLLALPWTTLVAAWAGTVPSDREIILIALAVGMGASGSILLSPVPAAAVIYTTTILLPLIVKCIFVLGGYHLFLGALAISFMLFLFALVASNARLFSERIEAVDKLRDSVRELSRAHEETERVAMTDGLTGIANRRAFMARLESLCSEISASAIHCVFYIDLDRFKAVNDALGHGVGDVLLKSVAARIENLVRDGDIVARLGGDEFAVIAHDILDRATASGLAERLVTSLSEPYRIEDHVVQIGASVGVAMASESDAEGNLLLKQADLAMYAAKEAGRNAYCLFEPNMQRSAEERRLVELGLRAAIVNDGFELLYQPIRELATDAIVGFECQVRWRHPLCGLLAPSHFLNIAAEIGIADSIGDWVIAEACRQAAMWPPNIVVGINLSSLQIGSGNLSDRVEKALMATGLPARRLELEIEVSESSLLHTDPEAIASLGRLKDMGVSIALDDFGTGYASLGYLVNFPFNRIKIDGMFVGELGRSKQSDLIVRSLAKLAKHLGCSVVAEGIETDEQRQRLRVLNVCHGQGPLLGKPMPARDVTGLLMAGGDGALAKSA